MKPRGFFFLVTAFLLLFKPAYGDSRQKIFNEGKEASIEHKWNKAINQFEKFIDRYPESQYMDEVLFWLGNSLERIPERQDEAFNTFGNLIKEYTNSPWLDNAMVHQLRLAEQFVNAGEEKYRKLLTERLSAMNREVRYRAAISLGKLGDKQALPVLQQIQEHPNLGRLATTLIGFLETGNDSVLATLDSTVERPKKVKSMFATKRYKQYRSLLRKDNGWSKPELVAFGMSHILEPDDFQEYLSLTDEFDRIQWYQNYWQQEAEEMDFNVSELRNEFERRIIFARTFFSDVSEHMDRIYRADQYLQSGEFRAPWDARGELYIKYGEPAKRYQAHWDGLDSEHWDYPDYKVDFVVYKQWTNIYLNAIKDGPTYYGFYENDPIRFERDYIRNAEFRYNTVHKGDTFESLSIHVGDTEDEYKGDVLVHYKLDGAELNNVIIDKTRQNILFIACSVLDARGREILNAVSTRAIILKDSPHVNVEGKIYLSLDPGDYIVKLKIQDFCSYKISFFEQDLTLQKKIEN